MEKQQRAKTATKVIITTPAPDINPDYAKRRDYHRNRVRRIVAFEAPDMAYKARLYLAAEQRRLSFNAWISEYVMPVLDKIMDEQGVPKDQPAVFRKLAGYRPDDQEWAALATGTPEPEQKRYLRRVHLGTSILAKR